VRKRQTVVIIVEVTYRDDKKKTYRCGDMPFMGAGWLNLYPAGNRTRRIMVPVEGIAEVDWWVEAV